MRIVLDQRALLEFAHCGGLKVEVEVFGKPVTCAPEAGGSRSGGARAQPRARDQHSGVLKIAAPIPRDWAHL